MTSIQTMKRTGKFLIYRTIIVAFCCLKYEYEYFLTVILKHFSYFEINPSLF